MTSDEKRQLRRLALQNSDQKTVVRVELDEPVSAAAAPAQVTVRALRGYDDQARRAGRLLDNLGFHGVEQGEDREPSSAATPPGWDRAGPAIGLLTWALSDFAAAMRENLPGLLDDVDTEFLHDFRVAVRRTRATLKLGRPALPEVMRSRWEPAFKWLGDMTTPVRDLDVYELDLPTMRGWLVSADPADLEPLATHLRSRRTAERRALVRRLRSVSFGRLLTEWEKELAGLIDLPDDADREHLSAGRLADRSISRAYRRVARGGAAISGDSPAEDLHRLRKRCKELRYALEVFAPVIDNGARKRAVADLKGLQDVLGRFQDSEVQRQALRGFAEEMMADGTPAGAVLAMGELIGHLDAEQDRARREFDVAFARFARPSSLQLMHRLGGRAVKVLATYNIKGGVGKTSTAVNLAYLAAREGRRTLLWDLDPQAAATYLFRVRPRVKGGGHALVTRKRPIEAALKATDFDNLDLLPADFSYRNMDLELDDTKKRTRRLGQLLDSVADDYDVVFLDCPPSISLVSENVLHASDTLLVPLIPATLSLRTLDQLTRFVADSQGSRPEVVAFFSMADRRKRLHRDVIDAIPRDGTRVADTVIPALSIIEQMAERRAPVPAFAPTSRAALLLRAAVGGGASAVSHPTVLAAGGVLWRRDPSDPEVALVHRPEYDDWSLPKGKAKPGSTCWSPPCGR